jgi:hypothetical protein
LIDLQKLKMQGIVLTKEYNMSDDLVDIRFEHDSHQNNMDLVKHVGFMKDGLVVLCVLIEVINQKVGPILELKGWSSHMGKNMHKFDRVMERFYHMFWKKGQSSPYMEFAWIFIGSMIMWHVQTKYLGGFPVSSLFGGGATQQAAQNGQGAQAQAAGASNGGGITSSLGNILRMFTGGSANEPQQVPQQAVPIQPARATSAGQGLHQPTRVAIPPRHQREQRNNQRGQRDDHRRQNSRQNSRQNARSNSRQNSGDSSSRRRSMRRPSAYLRDEGGGNVRPAVPTRVPTRINRLSTGKIPRSQASGDIRRMRPKVDQRQEPQNQQENRDTHPHRRRSANQPSRPSSLSLPAIVEEVSDTYVEEYDDAEDEVHDKNENDHHDAVSNGSNSQPSSPRHRDPVPLDD